MATDSSYSAGWEYDVFLSFRSPDTRHNFVPHLYRELKLKGVHTFVDDRELIRGATISPSLLEAIVKSRVAIVVLSKNYAYSSLCLDELVEIVECQETKDQIVLPIFYNIDPSEVKELTGDYGNAIMEHEKEFENIRVERWKTALRMVATFSGWNSGRSFNEVELIESIVKDVSDKLISHSVLVGIDSRVMEVNQLLDFECDDVRKVGIWGMPGIGKTVIAKAILDNFSDKFDSYGFLQDVKEKHELVGDTGLQKELLDKIIGVLDQNPHSDVDGSDLVRNMLCHKKVLIVLDGVDNLKQLNILTNILEWLGHGSRIIITTQNKDLLVAKGVNFIYEVPTLNYRESLQLFSQYAFMRYRPKADFISLSNRLISFVEGLPLALVAFGKYLYGKDIYLWENELDTLKGIPFPEINKVFRLCYNGLDDNSTKDVFIKIALSFIGKDIEEVCTSLSCPPNVLQVLADKALVTIQNDKLSMHNLIRVMALQIMEEEARWVAKLERYVSIINVILEALSAAFDQLSSPRKPYYALLSMLVSFLAAIFCVAELIYKGKKRRVTWKKWIVARFISVGWFYHPPPNCKRFGTVVDAVGMISAMLQLIFSVVQYVCTMRHIDSPVKIGVFAIVFALCVASSRLFKEKNEVEVELRTIVVQS